MDRKASILFVGDVNAHNEERLGSSTTNLHCRAARDFASPSSCVQLVPEPTHIDRGVLDFVLTNAPDVLGVRIFSPVGI